MESRNLFLLSINLSLSLIYFLYQVLQEVLLLFSFGFLFWAGIWLATISTILESLIDIDIFEDGGDLVIEVDSLFFDIIKGLQEPPELLGICLSTFELADLDGLSPRSNSVDALLCQIPELVVDLRIDQCPQKDSVVVLQAIGR